MTWLNVWMRKTCTKMEKKLSHEACVFCFWSLNILILWLSCRCLSFTLGTTATRTLQICIWWQMFDFVCLSLKRWFQFNSRRVRTHFEGTMALNNWEIIAETRGYIFRWRSRCCRGLVCLSSLMLLMTATKFESVLNLLMTCDWSVILTVFVFPLLV